MKTQRRAAPGGEIGANGDFYEGGKFIATKDRPKGKPQPRKPRKYEIENYVWVTEAPDGYLPIWPMLAGVHPYNRARKEFSPNYNYLELFERQNPEADARSFAFETMKQIDAFNSGNRWRKIPTHSPYWSEEFENLPEFI